MDNAHRCRNLALLCRQQATRYPDDSWKWLAQAERWEHLSESSLVLKEVAQLEPHDDRATQSI